MRLKLAAALSIVTALLLLNSIAGAEPTAYKLGMILALSGDAANFGKAAQNGATLAMESLPQAERARIKLTFEDDGFKAANSVSAFHKLVSIDKIDALICWSSGTCSAVAPLAEAAHLPTLAIASDAAISKGRSFLANLWVTPEEETKILVPEAVRRGIRKVAIVTAIQDGAIACRDAFLKESKGQIESLLNEEFPGDLKDFRSTVTKIKRLTELDAVLVVLYPGQLGAFAKQLRQAGVTQPIFGYETFEDQAEVSASGGALIGAWYATAGSADDSFIKRFEARFPGSNIVTASNAHDAVLLFAAASGARPDRESVAGYLRTVKNFSGASGTFSATGDNRFTLPATLRIVTKNGFEDLGRSAELQFRTQRP